MADDLPGNPDNPPPPARPNLDTSGWANDRVLSICGYLFVFASVVSFGTIAFLKIKDSLIGGRNDLPAGATWVELLQREDTAITLLLIAVTAAWLGQRLLTRMGMSNAQTIPDKDFPLVRDAVIAGKAEPIDQYVRLRALSGMSGTFTKLGITGLPLTTVFLTLVFCLISIIPIGSELQKSFLDLGKLTLGAFIGSFVQGRVEQRKQAQDDAGNAKPRPPALPV